MCGLAKAWQKAGVDLSGQVDGVALFLVLLFLGDDLREKTMHARLRVFLMLEKWGQMPARLDCWPYDSIDGAAEKRGISLRSRANPMFEG